RTALHRVHAGRVLSDLQFHQPGRGRGMRELQREIPRTRHDRDHGPPLAGRRIAGRGIPAPDLAAEPGEGEGPGRRGRRGDGLVNMENTYRNILRLQQDELKARETSLRGRIDAFRRELESREKAFGQLKERESDIVRKEDEFRSVMNRVHERQRELEKREELLRDKGRLLDERHHALSGGEVDLERKRWELEQKASGGRPATKEESTITVRSDSEIGELKSRMVQLEEQMERLMDERNELVEQQKEVLRLRDELKVVMKDVDDLLGDLPPDKIRTFAQSKKFALYEKILERLEL